MIWIAVLVVGIVLLFVGLNASHSLADRASDTFTGRFTRATTWYILGGTAAGILGMLLVVLTGSTKGA